MTCDPVYSKRIYPNLACKFKNLALFLQIIIPLTHLHQYLPCIIIGPRAKSFSDSFIGNFRGTKVTTPCVATARHQSKPSVCPEHLFRYSYLKSGLIIQISHAVFVIIQPPFPNSQILPMTQSHTLSSFCGFILLVHCRHCSYLKSDSHPLGLPGTQNLHTQSGSCDPPWPGVYLATPLPSGIKNLARDSSLLKLNMPLPIVARS